MNLFSGGNEAAAPPGWEERRRWALENHRYSAMPETVKVMVIVVLGAMGMV